MEEKYQLQWESHDAEELLRRLGNALTYARLSDERRHDLTRAMNAAAMARALIMGYPVPAVVKL